MNLSSKFLLPLLIVLLMPCTARANRVWAEYGLATATAGYDAKHDRTLISKYYIGAVGPDSVPDVVRDFIVSCAKSSAAIGALAFRSTPSPEVAARVAANIAFQSAFTGCVTTRGAAKFLAGQFYISFDRHVYWEEGLDLKFSAENPSAQSYAIVQRVIGNKVPDSLNRAIVLWYGLQAPPSISIKLQLPEGAKNFLKLAPTPAVMNQYAQKANADAINRGLTIIPEVLSEPKKLPETLGTAALQITQGQIEAQIQVYGQLTQQVADAANQGISVLNQASNRATIATLPIPGGLPPIRISPIPSIPTNPVDLGKKILCPFCN